jgi:hypothetical protein
MDFIQIIDGQSFSLMDINYILNNYDHLERVDESDFDKRVDESDFDKKLNLSEIRDCSSGSYGDLCKESENVIWDKNSPLVWDDFQGVLGTVPDDHDSTLSVDDTGARIFYYIDWQVWWEKSNNIPCEYTITKLDVVASTSKIESWVYLDRIEGEEDEILKHEQGHFDIAQIHAQEFKADYEGKDFACPSGIYDDDEIFNEIDGFWLLIEDDWNAMDKTYDKETDHHEDREVQAEWNKKIILLLSTEEYVKETSIPEWIKNNAIEEVPFIFEIRENDWTTGGIGTGNSVFLIITGDLQDKGFTKFTINGLFHASFPLTLEEQMHLTEGNAENWINFDWQYKPGSEYTLTAINGDYSTSVTWTPVPEIDVSVSTTTGDLVSIENLEKIHTRDIHIKDIFSGKMKDRWFVELEICSGERALSKPSLTIYSDIETVSHVLNKNINELSCAKIDTQVKAKDPETIIFEFEEATLNNSDELEELKKELETLKEIIKEEQSVSVVEEQSVSVVEEQSVSVVEEKGGGCLIATATYGSEMAKEVQQLRELRDNILLNTESGTQFMGMFNDIYYSFSPIIADYERENPYFKEAVKLAITPMISSLSLMENAETESEVLGMGLSVIMLNIGMYLGVPAVVIVGIRKRF